MGRHKNNNIQPIGMTMMMALLVTLAMAIVMQCLQEYRFYAKESEHLWLNDWMWIAPHFTRPGGFVQLLTSGITQFFCLQWVGALSLAVVFALVLATGWLLHRKMKIALGFISLWLLPIGFMFLCNEHSYYNFRGHLAILLSLLVAYGLVCLYNRPWSPRIAKQVVTLVATAATYWLAGSMSFLTVEVVIVYSLVSRKEWMQSLLAVWAYVVMAGISVKVRGVVSIEEALTPAQYYEWPASYTTPLMVWILLPVILILGSWLSPKLLEITERKKYMTPLVMTAGVALSVVVIAQAFVAVHNPRVYMLRQDEWHARCGQWDDIIKAHEGSNEPTAFISYLNLALAKKGQLVERMAEFNPYILWSDEAKMYSPVLMLNDELSADALRLQSCVFMEWGGAALANAQKSAFEANLLTPGDTNPTELKRLVITNNLFDTKETAQKYLRRLSRTTFYSDWAQQRIATIPDDELRELARSLPTANGFYMKTQIGKMLHQIVFQNPQNTIATQFYEAYLIQSGDSVAYRHWKEFSATVTSQPQ